MMHTYIGMSILFLCCLCIYNHVRVGKTLLYEHCLCMHIQTSTLYVQGQVRNLFKGDVTHYKLTDQERYK
jgi:hypothetical protein